MFSELPKFHDLPMFSELPKFPELSMFSELPRFPELPMFSELPKFPELPMFSELPKFFPSAFLGISDPFFSHPLLMLGYSIQSSVNPLRSQLSSMMLISCCNYYNTTSCYLTIRQSFFSRIMKLISKDLQPLNVCCRKPQLFLIIC